MNLTFRTMKYNENGFMWIPLDAASIPPECVVTEDAIPGFRIQYFEQYNSDPPLTGAMHLHGELTWGYLYPDLVLTSEKMMKRVVGCLKDDQRRPVKYGCNFGFSFMGAIWSHPENTGVEIDDGWVFMLNKEHPENPRLNGCYKAAWGTEACTTL